MKKELKNTVAGENKYFYANMDTNVIASYVVHKMGWKNYKKMLKEEANKIAAAVVKKEIEKNTCQNIACRHLKSKHLGDKRQCMVVTCPCSEFVKKQ